MSSNNCDTKSTTPNLYYERKLWGVCIICGKPLVNGEATLSCINCREKRKRYASNNRERVREQSREFRRRHKAAGLCIYCSLPAIEGKTMCEYHKEYYSSANLKLRKHKKEQTANANDSQAR